MIVFKRVGRKAFGRSLHASLFSLLSMWASAVMALPTIEATFAPTTIDKSTYTVLTISLDNPDPTPFTDGALTANLPAGLILGDEAFVTHDCGVESTITAPTGGTSISFAGVGLGLSQSCDISVLVSPTTAGDFTLTTGDFTSSAGNSGPATDDLSVPDFARFSLSAADANLNVGESTTLTFSFNYPADTNFVQFSGSLILPDGMAVASIPNYSTDCLSGPSITAGSSSINLNTTLLNTNPNCSFNVDITASSVGTKLLQTSSLTMPPSTNIGIQAAVVDVQVPVFDVTSAAPIAAGGVAQLDFTLNNFTRDTDYTNATFTLDLDAALTGLTALSLPQSDICGAGSNLSGTDTVTLSGGSIPAGGQCEFSIMVQVPAGAAAGTYPLTTSTLTADGLTDTPVATTELIVTSAPSVTFDLPVSSILAGEAFDLNATLTSNSLSDDATNVAFIVDMPAGFSFSGPVSNFCNGSGTMNLASLGIDDFAVSITNVTLTAGSSCTFSIPMTTSTDLGAITYGFTSEIGSSSVGGQSTPIYPAPTVNLDILPLPKVRVSLPNGIKPGESGNAIFELSLANATGMPNADSVAFNFDLNQFGLSTTQPSNGNADTFCGGTLQNTNQALAFSNGQLVPGETCSFNVPVVLDSSAISGTKSSNFDLTANMGGVAVTAAATATMIITSFEATMEVVGDVLPGEIAVLRYTLSNYSATEAMQGISFTQNLNSSINSLSASSLPATPCGAGSTITGTTNLVFSGGELAAGDSCVFEVDVLLPAATSYGSYETITSNFNLNEGAQPISVSPARTVFEVIEPITLSHTFDKDVYVSGESILLTYSLSNITSTKNFTAVGFTHDLDAALTGLQRQGTAVSSNTCSADVSGTSALTINNISLNAATSCEIQLELIAPTVSNTTLFDSVTSALSATLGASNYQLSSSSTQASVIASAAIIATSIATPSSTATNSGPVDFPVTFTNADQVNLITSNIELISSGTATATVSVTAGDTATPTVTLGNISGDGTLEFNILAGAARNNAGNTSELVSSAPITVDNTSPQLLLSSADNGSIINSPFTISLDFSAESEVLTFTNNDLQLTNATVESFTVTAGNSTTATVTPITDGTVTVAIQAGVISDAVGNPVSAQSVSLTYDDTQPTANISAPAQNINAPVTATVQFSEPVTGFGFASLTASNANLSNIQTISTSEYTVDISPNNEGAVTVDVNAGGVLDAAGNGNLTDSLALTYDISAPVLTINGPASAQSMPFNVFFSFNESVQNFIVDDVQLTNASISNFSGSGASYSALITPTADGSVEVSVAANIATDLATNPNTADTFNVVFDSVAPTVQLVGPTIDVNGVFTIDINFNESVTGLALDDFTLDNVTLSNLTGSGNAYQVDATPIQHGPASVTLNSAAVEDVAGLTNAAANYSVNVDIVPPSVAINTNSSVVNAAVTAVVAFSEDVSGFTANDVTTANAQITNFNAISASEYELEVTPVAEGDFTIQVPANIASDTAGNTNTSSQEALWSYDITAPVVEIVVPTSEQSGAFQVEFNFNESVSGFDATSLIINNGVLSNFAGSAQAYSATVTPTADGLSTITVVAGTAADEAGNTNIEASASVTADLTAPTATLTGPVGIQTQAFDVNIAFSEAVTGFALTDINVANGAASNLVGGAPNYTVTIEPAQDGNVLITVPAGAAQDNAGNDNLSATTSIVYDGSAPSLSISTANNSVTAPFVATFSFSESVQGFDAADINAINAEVSDFAGSGSQYSALVTPSADGLVTITVEANAAVDVASNGNDYASLAVTYDGTPPTVVISGPASVSEAFTVDLSFSETITGLDSSDITMMNGQVSNITGSGANYSATISPTSVGDVSISIEAGRVVDLFGNANLASAAFVTNYAPEVLELSSRFPSGGASGVALDAVVSFTFNQSISAVGGKTLTLSSAAGQVFSVDVTNLSLSGNTLTAAASELKANTTYTVQLEQGAFVTESGVTNKAIQWQFTTLSADIKAADDFVNTDEDTAVSFFPLANDDGGSSDIDTSSLVILQSASGQVSVVASTGEVTYTPVADFYGTDSFTYQFSNQDGETSNEATVSITVASVNDTPVFVSEPLQSAIVGEVYEYQAEVEDDSDNLTITAVTKPDWLTFDGIDTLSGTPSDEQLDQTFTVTLEVSDGELTQEQSFNIEVVDVALIELSLHYKWSQRPLVIGETQTLTLDVKNDSDLDALVDELSLTIVGGEFSSMDEICSKDDVLSCLSGQTILSGETTSLQFEVGASETGSVKVNANLSGSNIETVSKFTQVLVTNTRSDQGGARYENINASKLTFGDIDNDGDIDVILLSDNSVTALINDGSGLLSEALVISNEISAKTVRIADINADELNDVVFAGAEGVGLILASASGTFDKPVMLNTLDTRSIEVVDVDLDGALDIVQLYKAQPGFNVILQPFEPIEGNGPALTSLTITAPSIDLISSALFDVNGDGNLDVVMGADGANVHVIVAGSDVLSDIAVDSAVSVAVADVDQNAEDELYMTNGEQLYAFSQGELTEINLGVASYLSLQGIGKTLIIETQESELVFLGFDGEYRLGTGVFEPSMSNYLIVDLDQDGQPELLLLDEVQATLDVRFNQGEGNFGEQKADVALELTSTDEISVFIGDEYTIEADVMIALGYASDVTLRFNTPQSLVSVSVDGESCDLVTEGANTECMLGSLGTESVKTVLVTFKAQSEGQFTHNFLVESVTDDTNVDNNTFEVSAKVTQKAEPPVVEPEPKKSSGGSSSLLLIWLLLAMAPLRFKVKGRRL